jgi:site-specific DNA recombinase
MTEKRAAIYTRLSEDRRGTGDNVADQETFARGIAAEHGWSVEGVYDDNDRTAADPARKPRPGFDRLLADAEAGKFDLVICRHADRLYRHPSDQLRLSQTFGPRGITITQEWAGFPLDLATPTGVLQSGILAQVSLYELSHKSERQKAHNRQHIATGNPPEGGPVPFGYEADRLTPNEPEAEMIRDAHRVLLRGESLGSIIRAWNASDVTAPRGGRWTYSTVRGVLTRPLNAGLVVYDGAVLPGVKGKWAPLVTEEEHHAVVTLLSDPARRTTDGNRRKHLLAGVACCGSCLRPVKSGSVGSRGRKSLLYRCANKECERPVSIAREQLNAEVERRILTERGDLKVYRLVSITGHDAEALADVEARIRSVSARLGEDDADVPALVERLNELKALRARIKATPALPQIESGTVADEWAKAEGDLTRRRELLAGHLMPGGLSIAPRGKTTHRFDPTRVGIEWQPVLIEEGPVTFSPLDDDDFATVPRH